MATDLVSPLPPVSPTDSAAAPTPPLADASYLYVHPFNLFPENPLPSNIQQLGTDSITFNPDGSMSLDGHSSIQDSSTQSEAVNSPPPQSQQTSSDTANQAPTQTPQQRLAHYKDWLATTPSPPPLASRARRPRPEELEPLHPSKNGLPANLNYNIAQLKQFASEYKLRRGGNKGVLRQRLHAHLLRSWYATRIQAAYRGYLFRRYLRTKGLSTPARRPTNTSNDEELESLEPVDSIPFDQLFVIPNAGGVPTVYDVDVLRKLVRTQHEREKAPYDPYTNVPFRLGELDRLQEEARVKRLLGRDRVEMVMGATGEVVEVQLVVVENPEAMAANLFRLRIVDLCSRLDSLGHITNPSWFFGLDVNGWRRLCVELSDIWSYRAQLPRDVKARVAGDFPIAIPSRALSHAEIRHRAMNQAERMVHRGVDRDSKMLGANYLLIALTLVSPEAAEALPWLYQAGRLS